MLDSIAHIDFSGDKCSICEKIIELEIDTDEIEKDCVDCNGPGTLYHVNLDGSKDCEHAIAKVGHIKICDKCLDGRNVRKVLENLLVCSCESNS